MNYKLIIIFACVILHTNGFKFGTSIKSGSGGGFKSSSIHSHNTHSHNPINHDGFGGGFKNSGSKHSKTFNTPSINPHKTHSYNPPKPLFSSLSVPKPKTSSTLSARPFNTPVTSNHDNFGTHNGGVHQNNFHQNSGNTKNDFSHNTPKPLFSSLSVPKPKTSSTLSARPFNTPVTSNHDNFGTHNGGVHHNNFPQNSGHTINNFSSKPTGQAIGFKTPSNHPVNNGNNKLTPVASNNTNFGFLKGMPRNNLDKKYNNPSLAAGKNYNAQNRTHIHPIGFKNLSHTPFDGKVTPVISSNPENGFAKRNPRHTLDKNSENPPFPDNTKTNNLGNWNNSPKSHIVPTDFKANPGSQPLKLTPVQHSSSTGNVNSNTGDDWHSTHTPNNNMGGISNTPSNNGGHQTNSPSSSVSNGLAGMSSLNSLHKLNTSHHLSHQPNRTHFQNGANNFQQTNGSTVSTGLHKLNTSHHLSHQPNHTHFQNGTNNFQQTDNSIVATGLLGLSSVNSLHKLNTGHHPNRTHLQNGTNNFQHTNKTIAVLFKDLEAVKKNYTGVQKYLNTKNSQTKSDLSWLQTQLQYESEQLHKLNSTKIGLNNTNYNQILAITNKKILNLSKFIQLMNSTKYPGNKKHYIAGSFSDLKSSPHIKKAYSTSATQHSKILKLENSSTNNYARSQIIFAMSVIISLLIVI